MMYSEYFIEKGSSTGFDLQSGLAVQPLEA